MEAAWFVQSICQRLKCKTCSFMFCNFYCIGSINKQKNIKLHILNLYLETIIMKIRVENH